MKRPITTPEAREHAKQAANWRAPKLGGYSAQVPPGRVWRSDPPKGPGCVRPRKEG